uniref:Phlebovirus_G2 domain-containing protein n=1 Tax=Elaeophora elaphi TaxID=1147741 RepID=A0A0R3S4I1_9BILA
MKRNEEIIWELTKMSIITIKLLVRLIALQLLLLSLLPVTVVTDELLSARCQTMCLHQLEIASGVTECLCDDDSRTFCLSNSTFLLLFALPLATSIKSIRYAFGNGTLIFYKEIRKLGSLLDKPKIGGNHSQTLNYGENEEKD